MLVFLFFFEDLFVGSLKGVRRLQQRGCNPGNLSDFYSIIEYST